MHQMPGKINIILFNRLEAFDNNKENLHSQISALIQLNVYKELY